MHMDRIRKEEEQETYRKAQKLMERQYNKINMKTQNMRDQEGANYYRNMTKDSDLTIREKKEQRQLLNNIYQGRPLMTKHKDMESLHHPMVPAGSKAFISPRKDI